MPPTRLITGPAVEPVTVDDVKTHLRIDFDHDNPYLADLISWKREGLERNYLNSALITQTWELVLDAFPGGDVIKLPYPPLQSVTSVTYTDEDDVDTVYSSANYRVDTDSFPGRIVLKTGQSWPSTTLKEFGGLVIRFVAGYGDAKTDVPGPIKRALLLLLGDAYENREDTLIAQGVTVSTLPHSAKMEMQSYRLKEGY